MPNDQYQKLIDDGMVVRLPDGRVQMTRAAWQAATVGTRYEERGAYHFVGFKDDRYLTAVKTFGKPDFIHRFWDRRAVDEVAPGDVVFFADGDETQDVRTFSFDDSANF
jgi:hypothetical protein